MGAVPTALETIVEASGSDLETYSLCVEGRFGTARSIINCFTVDKVGKKVFSGSNDKTVHVYDSETCECVHVLRGHAAPVVSVVSLDNERLVSASRGDGTLRLWNVETGEELATVVAITPNNVTRLTGDTVIMTDWHRTDGITFTKIQFHPNGEFTRRVHRSNSLISIRIQGIVHFPSVLSNISVGDVSANDESIAVVCYDYPLRLVVKVWDSQSMNQRHEKSVPLAFQPVLALNEKYLVRTSFYSLVLYDVKTMEKILNIRLQFNPRSVQFTRCGNFVATLGKGRVLFYSVTDGSLMRQAAFETTSPPVLPPFQLLPRDRIVLKTRGSYEILLCRVRRHSRGNIINENNEDTQDEALPPLQAGLLAVMQGSASAGDQCAHLISKERCEASLSEWYAAHQLLVIAVNEGTVDRSPHFNDRLYWWMEQLYATVAKFPELSNADKDDVKTCLKDAHSLGVLDAPEAVVLGFEVIDYVNTDITAQKRACIRILERVLMVEGRFEDLKEAFFAYRRCQKYMNIIGIAVQLIPIAGGAVAGVLSAGADIVSGLSVNDLVDSAFQGGGLLVTEFASHLLTPRILTALDPERRLQLEQLFHEFGYTAEGVQELLHTAREGQGSSSEGGYDSNAHGRGTGAGLVDIPSGADETNSSETSSVETSNNGLEVSERTCADVDGTVTNEPLTASREMSASESFSSHKSAATSQARTSSPNLSQTAENLLSHGRGVDPQIAAAVTNQTEDETDRRFRRPSEFRDVDLSTNVRNMEAAELAGLWSAFVLRFNDDNQQDHILLARCLHRALQKEDIYGEDMCNFSESDRCSFLQSVLEILDCERGSSIPLGRRHRLQRFLQEVYVG